MKKINTYGDCFKVKFNILDYADIYPEPPTDVREYINWNKPVEECIWTKNIPEVITQRYREQEVKRVLRTGVWVFIKEMPVWIPPNYYFALQYGKAGSADMEFRLKRLKHVYFKIRARLNKGCKGTLTVKNRGDGETTMAIHDGFWECLDGNMETGQIGIQSKTRSDAKNPCWGYVQTLWQSLPIWFKNDLSGDFDSKENIAEKMQWQRNANELTNTKARNILFTFYPSGTSMDGKHDMKKCILDEICKWEEKSTFYDVFTNYSKFIMPGFQRRGMFDMFSSPADTQCKSNLEVYELWKDSNPEELVNNGTTKSRIHRWYSNPLEGIAGAYDKYGDAGPKEIFDFIMAERAKMPKDKLFAEIRGYPLNEEEMFGTAEGAFLWYNKKGIVIRNSFLVGCRVKNTKTNEPINIYGVHEWEGGNIDTEVVFRMSDATEFNLDDARVCYSYLPLAEEREPLKYRNTEDGQKPVPPRIVLNCIGVDPYDHRHTVGSAISNGAMVNQKFLDFYETGIVNCPTMIYSCRPQHPDVFYEDVLKAAVFNRAMVQVESKNKNIINHFEDRGYMDWMLAKRGEPQKSALKGDAPSGGGKNTFLNEIITMLNAITNTPLNEGDKYLLELNWFGKLLQDLLDFDKDNTHKSDLTMAWGQALMGVSKLLRKKIRDKNPVTGGILSYMLS